MSGIDNEVLVIPSTVKTIGGDYDKNDRGYNTGCGDHIFYDMGKDSSFKAFEVAEGNAYFKAKDGVLFNADMTRLVAYPRGKTDEVYEIPEGVVQLDAMCFSRPAYLKKLVLPDSFVISEEVPDNSLNQDGNNLAVAIYTFSRLEEIAVKETNPAFVTEDGLLYSKDKTVLWYAPLGKSGDIVISDKCRFAALGFAYMANNGYVKWNSLTIPASVEHIYADTVDDKLNRVMTGKIIVESGSLYYTVNESGKLEAIKYADGDIDMSGSVDEKDAELLLSYLSDMTLSVPINLNPADMDGNGSINVADVILIEDKL